MNKVQLKFSKARRSNAGKKFSGREQKRKLEEVFNYVPHSHQGLTPRTRAWVTSGGLSAVGTNLHKVFIKHGMMVITSVRPG